MSVRLLSDLSNPDGAELTFRTVVERMREAQDCIEIHMYVWRNDEIGNRVGRAVLEAAERGVKVRIIKDVGAFMFERIEMNRKSFFNKPISFGQKLNYRMLRPTFPDTYCEDDYTDELGWRIVNHPNVEMEWVNHTHTKYYIFDGRVMVLGSINIEDRHRQYYDCAVEIEGAEHIERFRARNQLAEPYDPARPLDFVLNQHGADGGRFEIKERMLALLDAAKESVTIEMAYIGDPEISAKIAAVAGAGVKVTMLFSRKANIGNDINYKSMHDLYRQAEIEAYLTNKMIHSKLMLVDGETTILGSANFSVFSMRKAGELDVVLHSNPAFIESLRATLRQRIAESERVESAAAFAGYKRSVAFLQQTHQKLNQLFN